MLFDHRQTANEFYADVLRDAEASGSVLKVLNELGRRDLFFLLTRLLHRKDVNRDWLFDRCNEVQLEPNGRLDLWAREHYKLQRLDEPTPTPEGWKNHGELVPGDTIFGLDGEMCNVVALNEIVYDADCYEIEFDDGVKIQSGAEHVWPVERRTRKRIPMAYKTDGPKRLYRETVLMQTQEIASHTHTPDKRLSIPVSSPIVTQERELPVLPYVLGVWLGDGTSDCGSVTSGDPEIFGRIEQFGCEVGEDKTPKRSAEYRNIVGLGPALGALGLRGKKKKIPEVYLRASVTQRLQLLQGMMDTDGSCNTRGTATFVNINDKLVEGFVELCHTLGLKPHKRRHETVYKGEPYFYWQVSFQAYKEFPVFTLERKLARCKDGARPDPRRYIVRCEKVETVPMRCIQVDREDGLYLTGRALVPTHNSTIITFGKSIQDIVDSHSKDSYYWEREITIGIFSAIRPLAKDFLKMIKTEFETNELLKQVYDDVLWENPQKEAPTWSLDDGIIVKRKSNPREATVEAWGIVEGMPTGKHFVLRVYDDVVTEKHVSTTDQIKKTTSQWGLSTNLGAEGGEVRYIGTRYHFNDTYRVIMERKAAIPRVYPATHDGTPQGRSVFISQAALAEKRRTQGPYIFACQQLQNPKAEDAMGFVEKWIRYYDGAYYLRGESPWPLNWNYYLLCDPAGEKKKENDYTVMLVIALAPDRNYYLVDGIRDRMNLKERTDKLFYFRRKYNIHGDVGYEKYGKDSDIEHIQEKMEEKNYRFGIIALGGAMPKNDRIRRLVPVFNEGRFYIPHELMYVDYEGNTQNLIEIFIRDEYLPFPVPVHDDILDCMARIRDPQFGADFPLELPPAHKLAAAKAYDLLEYR